MKASKCMLLGMIFIIAASPATAQSRSEKKAQTERAVKQAIDSKNFVIDVDYMQPMKGNSRPLTSNYSLKVKNDSVFSYLPYFGVAYSAPYGGGKGLIFNAPVSEYQTEYLKKGKVRISFDTRNEEDYYQYRLTIFPNGSTSISVQPNRKQAISFTGNMDIKK